MAGVVQWSFSPADESNYLHYNMPFPKRQGKHPKKHFYYPKEGGIKASLHCGVNGRKECFREKDNLFACCSSDTLESIADVRGDRTTAEQGKENKLLNSHPKM